MGDVKCHGCRRGADVQHGDCPLQFVMTCLVEEVTEPDHPNRFTGEVHGKSRGTAAEHAGYRVQLLSATAQVVPGDDEISSTEGGACRKQDAILPVPESTMTGRFGQRSGSERIHRRNWFHRLRAKQRHRDLL